MNTMFIGSVKDFNDFIGPLLRNIVCNLSRNLKKKTTCRHEGCGKRKPLEAAHIKGKERTSIIAKILIDYKVGDDLYEVDLLEFKSKFIAEHTPIDEVILPMCKEHHLEYDRVEKLEPEFPVIIDGLIDLEGKENYSEEELLELERLEVEELRKAIQVFDISNIKQLVSDKTGLPKSQISFSRVSESNGLWNFDINRTKFTSDFAFIFVDQISNTYKVCVVKGNTLDLSIFGKKDDNNIIRFFVDENFVDRSGYRFSNLIEI